MPGASFKSLYTPEGSRSTTCWFGRTTENILSKPASCQLVARRIAETIEDSQNSMRQIPLERTDQAILSAASRRSYCSGPGTTIPYRTQMRLVCRGHGPSRAFRRVIRVPRAPSPPRNDIVRAPSTNDSSPCLSLAMLECRNELQKKVAAYLEDYIAT